MESNYIFNNLLDNRNKFEFLRDLSDEEIIFLKQRVASIDDSFLFKHQFHGVYHSQKVFLFGYLIAKQFNISENDLKVLYDALLLHDCGRIDEFEESFHGLVGANKLKDKYKSDELYLKEPNLDLLCAIVDAHSTTDDLSKTIAYNYSLDDFYDRFLVLCCILKDADALDRTRFPKQSKAFVEGNLLRYDFSKELVDFAYKVNRFYNDLIDRINFERYSKDYLISPKNNGCMHSIGWDFSKLEGILDHGILSNYAASNRNITLSRNFEGNNSNMWISVVDSKKIQRKGKCYDSFLMNGICFYSLVGKLFDGEESKSKANSMGLPRKSGEYNDESFAFYEIPPEDIIAIICPMDSFKSRLLNLNYFNCTNGFEVIKNRVDNYIKFIKRIDNLTFDTSSIYEKIEKMKNLQIDFLSQNEYYQRTNLHKFIKINETIIESINKIISELMDRFFRVYFNLNDNEYPTVEMVILDILSRKKIDFSVFQGSSIEDGTTIFIKTNSKSKEDDYYKK